MLLVAYEMQSDAIFESQELSAQVSCKNSNYCNTQDFSQKEYVSFTFKSLAFKALKVSWEDFL
jgi:hypothetical protein